MSESREAISLWQETLDALSEHGKTWDDVLFVGIGREKQMLRSVFEGLAKALFYRPWCYGGNLIDTNLQLYGEDFILTRQEYDGSEWWAFYHTKPNQDAVIVSDLDEIKDRFWRERE